MKLRKGWGRFRASSRSVAGHIGLALLGWRGCPRWAASYAARIATGSQPLRALGLGDLTGARLLVVARHGELRALLTRDVRVDPDRLINIGGAEGDLLAAVMLRLRGSDDAAVSEALTKAILGEETAEQRQAMFGMSVVMVDAQRLVPQHARAIFGHCLGLVCRPSDPYDPVGAPVTGLARQAAAAILAIDSALDADVAEALRDPAARANVQALAASAIKERPDEASDRYLSYLSALSASAEAAIRFAEDCDADRSTLRPTLQRPPTLIVRLASRAARANLASTVSLLMAGVLPLTTAVALAFACRQASPALVKAGIDPGVAIGALAVLVAVHVLSVQLAAQRLPGPIAAGTVLSPLMVAAYVTGLAVVVTSILGKEDPPLAWNPGLVASGMLILFIGLVIAASSASLRGTAVASAAESVGRRRIRQARRAGKRAGQLHKAAFAVQRVVGDEPAVRQFISPQESTQRYPIPAGRSGFLRVDAARVAKVVSGRAWREGDVRLDLLVASGVAVTTGQEIGSIVPAAGFRVQSEDLRAVDRVFAVRNERTLERFAELCASLCSQIPVLVSGGDPGGARRVLHVLLALLEEHLDADIRSTGARAGGLPLSPALTQTVDQAVVGMRAGSERERDMLCRLLQALVRRSRKDDGLLTVLALKLGEGRSLAEYRALYEAGCRAALNESGAELLAVQQAFDRLVPGAEKEARYANENAGRLVLYCAAAAPRLSRSAWSRWWGAAQRTPVPDRIQIAIRIGAGALPVGNLSLAVEIALALKGEGAEFNELIASAHRQDRAAFEQYLSESYGRLLGSDAEQRIVAFLGFARDACAGIVA